LPRGNTSPIKEGFVPKFDLIGNGDLSQIEWTAAVFQSQDPVGIAEIMAGVDQHRENAITFFGADPTLDKNHEDFKPIRTTAKVFQFRLLYGGGAYGMAKDPTMPSYSFKEWQEIVEAYQAKYSVLTAWQQKNIDYVHGSGGWMQIPTGRLFYFKKLDKPDWNGYCYEQAQIKNYPTQGFATGDITPLAMIIIDHEMQRRKLISKIILQVHDSIVFDMVRGEVDDIADIVFTTFKNLPRLIEVVYGFNFNLPIKGEFDVGPNYGALKSYHEGDY
jgi:DNA polymerase-1